MSIIAHLFLDIKMRLKTKSGEKRETVNKLNFKVFMCDFHKF